MTSSNQPDKRPNIFIIVVDCLRADRCPTDPDDPYNAHLHFWPRFRESACCFSQMISTASVTPVCFASILTGQYSFAHGIRTISGPALNPDVPTLATILQSRGYHTHAYLTGPLEPLFGLDRGFDEYQCRQRKQRIYTDWGDKLFNELPAVLARKPCFVLLHLFELHYPRSVMKRKARRRSAKRYDYAWWELDEQLEKIMALVPENTITILTADHGERLYRPSDKNIISYLRRKYRKKFKLPLRTCDGRDHGFHVFEDLIRIPLALHGPGIPQGRVIDQQVSQTDIMPTIIDLLGYELPLATHGSSLAPLIRGEKPPEKPVFLETGNIDLWRRWRGLRSRRWKYAEKHDEQIQETSDYQLYDLLHDPREKHNVADQNHDVVIKMQNDMQAILQVNPLGPGAAGRQLTPQEQEQLNEKLKALGYL